MQRSSRPSISSESGTGLDRRLHIGARQTVREGADAIGLIRSLPSHPQILPFQLQLSSPFRRDQGPATGITINPRSPEGTQPLLKSPEGVLIQRCALRWQV